MIPDQVSTRKWIEAIVSPASELTCLHCGNLGVFKVSRKTVQYLCHARKKYFNVKTGTAFESISLPWRNWIWAIYLESTILKAFPA